MATLVPADGKICFGRAFLPDAGLRDEILAQLDLREQGGYQLLSIPLHFPGGRQVWGSSYVATSENPHYLGSDTLEAMASQILGCHGMSGSNREYLFRLADSLRSQSCVDAHVEDLVAAVLGLEREGAP